jgi:hypothetical protein
MYELAPMANVAPNSLRRTGSGASSSLLGLLPILDPSIESRMAERFVYR